MAKKSKTFEPYYDNSSSATNWRKPQGLYLRDAYAYREADKFISKHLKYSLWFNFILLVLLFFMLIGFLWFTNFETVYITDGTLTSCIIKEDGSISIAY